MSDAAVTKWKNKAEELATKYKNFRASIQEHSEHASRVVMGTVLTAGGGVVAALLDAKMPTMPVTGGDSKLVVGGALVSLALMDIAGDYGEQMTEIGSGILSIVAYEHAKAALSK
jgi:hypothetical protein